MTSNIILRTQNLSKKYRERWAVKNLNLEVHRGDVFGFLGPNGAGKSTTIRMLLSLIKPTTGYVELFGYRLNLNREHALKNVGRLVEKADFYLYLSARKNLEILASLCDGIEKKRIQEVIELVGLHGRENDTLKTYSHGMKQRLGIAQALLSDPELIILDEPTSGLDPQGMKEVRDLISHLAHDRNKTIVLSSHLLSEIELVSNRMAIINKGELVVQGEVSELLEKGEQYVILRATPKEKVLSILKKQKKYITSIQEKENDFHLGMDFEHIPALTTLMVNSKIDIQAVIPRRSLEDYFLSITESVL